jgi:hypothetical protein
MANNSSRLVTAAGMLALFVAPCPAQPPGFAPSGVGQPPITSRPTISPYLNLTRRGGSTASNYYNLVRPQNQFYQSIQQIQQEVGANVQELSALQQQSASGLRPTGHVAGFLNHGAYFMTMGRAPTARLGQPMMSPGVGRAGLGSTMGQGGMGLPGGQPGQMGGRPAPSGRR